MLLGNTLLRDAVELDLLVLAKLDNEGSVAIRVVDDRMATLRVSVISLALDNQVARVDIHVLVRGALDVERQLDAATVAILLAFTVALSNQLVGTQGMKRDQSKTVSDKLVGEDRGVLLNLNEVDGESRDLGHHDATKRVHHGQRHIAGLELNGGSIGLFSLTPR
jgi:hypothetical protein